MKKFSRYESEISSILGMLVVAAIAVFIFLFVKKFLPKPSIGQTADQTQQTSEQTTPSPTTSGTYTVKNGQGLSQIAQEVLGDGKRWVEIAKANDLKAPYTLRAGQELKMPEAAVVATTPEVTPAPVATPEATPTAVAPTTAPTSTGTSDTEYIVQKGDHLWKIAVAEYGDGHAWVKIYQANKKLIGKNPGRIFSGNKLVLPR